MRKIAVLGSTRGTDLQAIIDAIEARTLQAEISVVISDRRRSGILERARSQGIKALYIPSIQKGTRKEREIYDREVDTALREGGAELVLLIGYMRIVSPWFCRAWEERLINVHPSLLPEFAGGMDGDVHEAVIASGKRESGCTVHLVTEKVDEGPIILQKKCVVRDDDDSQSLKSRVQELEGKALIEIIDQYKPLRGNS